MTVFMPLVRQEVSGVVVDEAQLAAGLAAFAAEIHCKAVRLELSTYTDVKLWLGEVKLRTGVNNVAYNNDGSPALVVLYHYGTQDYYAFQANETTEGSTWVVEGLYRTDPGHELWLSVYGICQRPERTSDH